MAIVDLTKCFDGFEMAFPVFGIGLADLHKGFNSFEMGFCIFEVGSTDLVKSFIDFKIEFGWSYSGFFNDFEMDLADLGQDFNGFVMLILISV